MSKQIWKPGTLLSPVPPALVSCGSLDRPNILTVAWTGIVNSAPAMTYISVREQRFSYELIRQSGEFVINLTTKMLVRAADFCGVRSGRDTDKFAAMHLTPLQASLVRAPLIAESPLSMECKVVEVKPLGSHTMFLAEIVAIQVEDTLVDKRGKLHLEKCGLAAYVHGEYFELGASLGTFGFSVRKKPQKKR